jgi:hypothetical protein
LSFSAPILRFYWFNYYDIYNLGKLITQDIQIAKIFLSECYLWYGRVNLVCGAEFCTRDEK